MRLLNIETGYLQIVNFKNFKTSYNNYIAISHRWLNDEIELLDLGLIGIGKIVNIGDKLYDDLNSKISKSLGTDYCLNLNFGHEQKNQKWNDYLYFLNNNKNIDHENINNHYKLANIVNCILNNKKNNKIKYIWLDTICIDKSSSSEMNENIVSMYNIYKYAKYVHVYLNDDYIKNDNYENNIIEEVLKDEWWTRGWTLQEYLANENVKFHDKNNNYICDKYDIWEYSKILYNNEIINIKSYLFEDYEKMINKCKIIGTVFCWMDDRVSKLDEDKIYSLMGILESYIIPMYGEGYENSKKRLINEYILNNNDNSIFDWIGYSVDYRHNNIIRFNDYINEKNYIKELKRVNGKFKITTNIRIIEKDKIRFKKIHYGENDLYKRWCNKKKINHEHSTNTTQSAYDIYEILIDKCFLGILIPEIYYLEFEKLIISKNFLHSEFCIIYFGISNKIIAKLNNINEYYHIEKIGKFVDSLDTNFNPIKEKEIISCKNISFSF